MPNDKDKPNQPVPPPAAEAPSKEDESLDTLEPPASQPAPSLTTQAPDDDAKPPAPKKTGLLQKFSIFGNLWLIIFGLLILTAGVVIYVSMQAAKKQNGTTTKTTSLTSQQISSIKGNTTLVGDSKQTLDIQSNSIFEGQILARSDLNVAGTLKVGGPLSLPSVTVGGSGTFGQLGVSGGINVGGDTTLQGQLTVQKNLSVVGSASFGSLSVSSLSISTLQLKGDLTINQHIVSTGGVPGRTNGSALGSGGSASINGSDTAGTVAINTGGSPPAGCFVTVNFAKSFASTPHVVISPSNSSAGALQYYTNRGASSFSICTANAPAAGTTYLFDYLVIN